uniref:Uncharacterized protein n=1 Tax=Aliivibrio wodanis TaxID=80852 RepID=A0A5Q4ZJ20_9GAMM|nr:hypothetical protein AW0309160_01932 [Aliivibrio wodanis]
MAYFTLKIKVIAYLLCVKTQSFAIKILLTLESTYSTELYTLYRYRVKDT